MALSKILENSITDGVISAAKLKDFSAAVDLNGVELILDADQDTSITADTDDVIDFKIAGVEHISLSNSSGDTIIKPRVDGKDIIFQQFDGKKLFEINDGNFVSVGGNNAAAGQIRIFEDTDNGSHYSGFTVGNLTESYVLALPNADGSSGQALTTNGSGVLSFTTLSANTPSSADGQALGSASLEWSDLFLADGAVINFGADQDVTLTHNADTGLTLNTILAAAELDISGNIDVDGTTNLDVVDIDGAVQIDSTLTIGVDDTGHDVKFFGATSGSYMQWDESTDDLILGGAARLGIGTASPARSLEIAAQIPVIRITDTDASAGYMEMSGAGNEFKLDLDKDDALASSILTFKVDGSYVMKFRDGASEFADGTAAAPSITNIGDTNTGLSFSAADTMAFSAGGTAQFTMADGVIAPVTDNDVDLGTSSLEFKDGYFDGTVHTDAINLNGTAITSTAAELNILDDATVTTGELNLIDGGATVGTTAVADGDGVLHNDGGTMRVTSAATFKTYFQEGISQAYDDFTIGDAAVLITTSSGNITIDAAASDSDIIFKGTDGGADTVYGTFDGSAGGDLFLTGGLIDLKNDGSAVSQIKFYCESSNAHAQTLIGAPHAETGTNTLTLPSSGGDSKLLSATSTATVTNKTLTTPKVVDNGYIQFGTDNEVRLISNPDKGVIVKHIATADDKPVSLTLQTGETDMAANDVIGAVDFQAPDEGTGTDAILVAAGIEAVAEGDFSSSSNATSLVFKTGASEAAAGKIKVTSAGHLFPMADDSYDLGGASNQWRNIYTGDLHLSNMSKAEGNVVDGTKGDWTIQEGAEELYLMNNNSGKKYKFNLTEV